MARRSKTSEEPKRTNVAVGYVRVSTSQQATEGLSIDAQIQRIREYCSFNGLDLVAVYGDPGVSGKSADKRKGLQCLLHLSDKRRINHVVVYSLSRLARSVRDALAISDRLAKNTTDLHSISEKIDTSTPFGKFFFTVTNALSELERDQVSERTKAVLGYRKAQGLKNGGYAPYGFEPGPDGKLVPVPHEQTVLKRIRRMRAKYSAGYIARRLNEEGIPSKKGGQWHETQIVRLCK